MARKQCSTRLEGGPFDGDEGMLQWYDDRPPKLIYCVGCGNPSCPAGGIHWTGDLTHAEEQAEKIGTTVERYRHGRKDGSWLIYVYGDLLTDNHGLLRSEPEPVTA